MGVWVSGASPHANLSVSQHSTPQQTRAHKSTKGHTLPTTKDLICTGGIDTQHCQRPQSETQQHEQHDATSAVKNAGEPFALEFLCGLDTVGRGGWLGEVLLAKHTHGTQSAQHDTFNTTTQEISTEYARIASQTVTGRNQSQLETERWDQTCRSAAVVAPVDALLRVYSEYYPLDCDMRGFACRNRSQQR